VSAGGPCASPVAAGLPPLRAPLFRRPEFRAVAGDTLRPGGLFLTGRGLDAAGFSPGDRVADVGCGPGASLDFLRRRGLGAMGFEADPGYAAEASFRAAGGVAVARAEALPLPDGSLDGVLCECALSVFANPHAALAEMARTLVPGGRLVVADLYRTDGEGGEDGDAVADGSCAAGAVGREAVLARFARAGLAPRLFEDHSRLVAELAGRLVFAGFDAAEAGAILAGRAGGCACRPGGVRPRLGYYLCIAVKEGI